MTEPRRDMLLKKEDGWYLPCLKCRVDWWDGVPMKIGGTFSDGTVQLEGILSPHVHTAPECPAHGDRLTGLSAEDAAFVLSMRTQLAAADGPEVAHWRRLMRRLSGITAAAIARAQEAEALLEGVKEQLGTALHRNMTEVARREKLEAALRVLLFEVQEIREPKGTKRYMAAAMVKARAALADAPSTKEA